MLSALLGKDWVEGAIPHTHVGLHNPLFKYQVRRVRWGQSASQLKGYTLKVLLLVHGAILALWLLAVQSDVAAHTAGVAFPGAFPHTEKFLLGLLVSSMGANLFLDVIGMAVAIDSLRDELVTGRWDLLRLTALPHDDMVIAKYSLAQLRAWPTTIVIVSLRIASLVLLVLHVVLLPFVMRGTNVALGAFLASFLFTPFFWFLILSTVVAFALIYTIEPLWRMYALTALGVMISARMPNLTQGLLLGFAAILGLWIAQSLILVALAASLIAFFIALFCGPFLWGAVGWGVYKFYRLLKERALQRASDYLFAS